MSDVVYKDIAFNAANVAKKTQAEFIKSVRLNKAGEKVSEAGLSCDQQPTMTDDDLKEVHKLCTEAVKSSAPAEVTKDDPPSPPAGKK